jgi:hypothetical protein
MVPRTTILAPGRNSPLSFSVRIPAIFPVVPEKSGPDRTMVRDRINRMIFLRCFMVNYSLKFKVNDG